MLERMAGGRPDLSQVEETMASDAIRMSALGHFRTFAIDGKILMGTSKNFRSARHSREGGNPVSLVVNDLESLDPRLRGDDGKHFGFLEVP